MSTPWRKGAMIGKPKNPRDNAARNQAALKKMTQCELYTGKTPEQLRAEMQEQRAAVLKRHGILP